MAGIAGSGSASNRLFLQGAGTITLDGFINSSINNGLVKEGTGTLVLSGANNYGGGTIISSGSLRVGNASALGNSSGALAVNGGTLDLNGSSVSVSALSGSSGSLITTANAAGTATLTTSVTSGTSTYAGAIRDNGSGLVALTKSGAADLALTGTNTFTGATTISGGVLRINSADALKATSGVNVAGGAAFAWDGGTANFDRNITVTAGSGTGTVTNSGGGLLTLSGTLSKDDSVLRLTGGSFNVTGMITGSTPGKSDFFVDGASVTFSHVNTYNGPTKISNSGTLALAVNNAIPGNSVVTLGDASSVGTLVTSTFSNAIGGLDFGSAGGTVRLAATSTSAASLTAAAGTITLTNGTLDLAGSGSTAGLYHVLSAQSIGGSLTSITGTNAAYQVITTATSVDYQQKAVLGTVTVANPASAIIAGGSAAFGYTVANANAGGGASLSFTGSGLSDVGGSASGEAAGAGASTATGLYFTGATVGSGRTGTFTVSAPGVYGATTATGTVSVDVYDHGQLVLSSSTISLGNAYVGYGSPITATLTGSNAAGYRVAVSGSAASAGGISLSSLSNLASTGTITATLATGGAAGAINQSFNYVYGDGSSSSGLNGYAAITGTAAITVTAALWNPAAVNTIAAVSLGNVRVSGTFGTQTLSIQNTAASGSSTEVLGATAVASGQASSSGSVVALVGGGTSMAISVGLGGSTSAVTAGMKSGSATISFTSTGGPSTASIASQTVAVTGTVWNTAAGSITSDTTIDLGLIHAGGSFGTRSLTITNTAPDDFSEGLNAAVGGLGGDASFGGTAITNLSAGNASSTITVGLANADTSAGGSKSGSVTISYDSDGTTTSGLNTISAGSQVVSLTGSVFSGTGTWNVAGGGTWGSGAGGNWTSTGGVQAAPGTFNGYSATDVAILAGTQRGSSTVLLDGATPSLAALVFSNTTGRYVIDQGSGGSLTLAAANGKPTVDVVAGGRHEIKTAIFGLSGLNKIGDGTLVLSGSSDFTGGTDVSAGKLAVNGFLGGAMDVSSGALLAGSGTIGGAVSILEGGILAPGNSPGTLTMASGLSLAGSSILNFELSGTDFTVGGGINDLVVVTGDLTLGGILNVAATDGGDFTGVADHSKWTLFTYTGALTNNGLSFGSMPTLGGDRYFTIDTSTVGEVYLVAVPEPAAVSLALVGIAAAAVWTVRRRLRRM